MSPFDFFKKSNKKKPAKNTPPASSGGQGNQPQSATDNPFSSPELNKKRYEAATDFLQFFQEKTPLLNGKPHAGTVLSIGARLAGTSLFRALNKKDVKPGIVVLSEEVNQAYPQLLNMFAYYCKQSGIDVMAKPLVQEIPEQDKPRMDLSQIQAEYQKSYNLIMKKHGLDDLESARAGMIVCSMFFNYHCMKNKDIDPYVATGIVAMGVVEGAKTSPVPLGTKAQSTATGSGSKTDQAAELLKSLAESSISGSGTTFFFGERDAAVQEALDHNGKFILVHPEVESKLKEGNIDPYTVYVTALIIEMQSRIPQIDFVGGNVDQLAQQWSGKSEQSIPVHVRQMLWLKANAEKFGYQQSGNSWILK
jgi:hypothetical protein